MNSPVAFAPGSMPAFIWFADPTHLTTAQEVKAEDFAAVIGDFTHLINAQLQTTNDRVTIDLDKKWPAYAEFPMYKGMGMYTALNGLQLGSGQFISTGDY